MDQSITPPNVVLISTGHQISESSNKMFNSTQDDRSMQQVSQPKRGAAEPVNLKIHRNPATTTPVAERSRSHFFARISCVYKVV